MRISDWSSDVCSSDLLGGRARRRPRGHHVSRPRGGDRRHRGYLRRSQPPLQPGTAVRSASSDRKSAVSGKSVTVCVALAGRSHLEKKISNQKDTRLTQGTKREEQANNEYNDTY